jgi:hypothetical protein
MRSAAFLLVALTACTEAAPTIIDGSSPEAFSQSVAAAREELSSADRLLFDRALAGVPARRYSNQDPDRLAHTTFDGMTAAQIVADQRNRE